MSLVLVTLRRGLKSLPSAGENVVFHVTLASKLAQKDSRSMCCKTASLTGERGLGLRFFPQVFFGIAGRFGSVNFFWIGKFFSQFLWGKFFWGSPGTSHATHLAEVFPCAAFRLLARKEGDLDLQFGGYFNWTIPNHYIKNAWKQHHFHPFKTGCLELFRDVPCSQKNASCPHGTFGSGIGATEPSISTRPAGTSTSGEPRWTGWWFPGLKDWIHTKYNKTHQNPKVVVSTISYFHPYLGKIPILTIIFFRWVVETTNQNRSRFISYHLLNLPPGTIEGTC